MKKTFFILLILSVFFVFVPQAFATTSHPTLWQFQSIDTMKYSRDPSREFLGDLPKAQLLIDQQIEAIAKTGATHVGIATPYDEEFLPLLNMWVATARKNNLKVWFRGNWSGWEQWFGYSKISSEEHHTKTREFILQNPDLFEDGDIFSGCPECENGGPGDPRLTGKPNEFRQFLFDEYQVTTTAFQQIRKNVRSNVFSMNGDVARLIMDKETTKKLDGIVTVDHYVKTPEQVNDDLTRLAEQSGGQIILGEWGAPIPDIHGAMNQAEQAQWIKRALQLFAENPHIVGLNYWTNVGGSTQLWNEDGTPRQAVEAITEYYTPPTIEGKITNLMGEPVPQAKVRYKNQEIVSDTQGVFRLAVTQRKGTVFVSAKKHQDTQLELTELTPIPLEISLGSQAEPFNTPLTHWLSSLVQTILRLFKR